MSEDDLTLSSVENWTLPQVGTKEVSSQFPASAPGVRRWRELTQFGEKTDIDLDLPPRIVRVYGEARCGETAVLNTQERRLSYLLNDPGIKGGRRTRIEAGLAEIRARQERIARLIASENARQAPQGIVKRSEESPATRAMPEVSDAEKLAQLRVNLEDLALSILTESGEEAHREATERYLRLHREKQRLQAMLELQDDAERARLRHQDAPSADALTHSALPPDASASPEGSPEPQETQTAQGAPSLAPDGSVASVDSREGSEPTTTRAAAPAHGGGSTSLRAHPSVVRQKDGSWRRE